MHKKHIEPTNDFADFIIKNNEEYVGDEKERMLNLSHTKKIDIKVKDIDKIQII